MKPGKMTAPRQSISWVAPPRSASTSAVAPTAMMRPPRSAMASARGRLGSMVSTVAWQRIKVGGWYDMRGYLGCVFPTEPSPSREEGSGRG
jgi:hypothetical protein